MGWELFKNYLIAKEKFKPDFFLYENNKSASQAIKDQIAEEFGVGVDPKVRFTYINSALVSAQNRQRFYVTNFGDIEQPEDRGILLKDILETGQPRSEKSPCIDASYYKGGNLSNLGKQSGERLQCAELVRIPEYGDADKARPINAHYSNNCGGFEHRMFNPNPAKQQVDMIAEPINTTPDGKSQTIKAQYQNTSTVNVCCYKSTYGATEVAEPVNETSDGKSHTVKAQYYKNGTANFVTNGGFGASGVAEPIRVGSLPRPNGELSTSQAMQIYSQEGKSTTQMAGGGGLGGKTGLYAIPVEFEDGIPTKAVSCADGKTYTVYKVVDGLITIKGKEYPIKLKDGYYIIRKLTVRECARLQTMPDDYCKAVSDSQAYKALGNGWTAEVIIHLLNHALKDVPRDEEIIVLSMYDGIATGRYCLDKMGFTNVTYHAYEIDKYPIMVAMDNYPDIIQHGDAFAVREDDWKAPQTRSEWLDDLLGGAL
jgi:DNA (cytosine-5)-methyltransferase 3A